MASVIDEDTKQTVASGRATIGSLLTSARDDLRKAFVVFVIGFLGTFYLMRVYVWAQLKADLNPKGTAKVVTISPFDVILLQVKIGMVVGILLTLPVILYYGRDALRARGWWPLERVARWKLAAVGLLSAVLFLIGIGYAYFLFFPIMLNFLAENAVNAGLQPSWGIVRWTQFIALLSLSFGLAAQLPLVMSALSYLRIVSYETFRDKWRYAVVMIFVFGALFSPPDPFTQIMWALPLCALYAFSLTLAKYAQLLRRSTEEVGIPALARENWNLLAGTGVLVFAGVYLFFVRGGVAAVNDALTAVPKGYRPGPFPGIGEALGLDPRIGAALVGAVLTAVVLGAVLFALAIRELGSRPAAAGKSPADIDLSRLDAGAIGVAPPEAFEAMSEEDALNEASRAMEEEDDPEKAQAILDRWDEVQEMAEDDAEDEAAAADAEAAAEADEDEDVITSTTAGVVDAFTEDETNEDDIGGYYNDIAFILESLTSRAFRIVGVFMVVMAATFVYLYRGGIGEIRNTFLERMPDAMAEKVDIVTLHPVEALIFEIKVATIFGLVAALPLVFYYAWPALKKRGWVGGDRRYLLVWGGTLVAGIVAGSAFGFLYVAPAIISWLATDALQAHMVISYRIGNFGWLVLFTTVGIGLLAEIPVTMFLFHQGGIASFTTMRERWRGIVMGIVVASALFTPSSLLTMIVLAVPTVVAFFAGLGLLWVYTLGGRRTRSPDREAAD